MTDQTTIQCRGYAGQSAHDAPADADHFNPWALRNAGVKPVRCRDCDKRSRQAEADKASLKGLNFATATDSADRVSDEQAGRAHEYIASKELMQLWKAVVSGTLEGGDPPANIVFFGPKGTGKTDGAKFLAASVGLPFTKVDAASMDDPTAWFGTREVVVEDGASATKYVPSPLVEALQKPGVVFIDEFNRVDDEHRNVWLPLTDGTGRVTNPLNGELVIRHPHCFILMAGNRGLQYTGVSAIDIAFTSRAYIVEFDYLKAEDEERVVREATGADPATAKVLVRLANETRQKAAIDEDFDPISTREVLMAARAVKNGLSRDLAVKMTILNQASADGGTSSVRTQLEQIWAGIRVTADEADATPDTSEGDGTGGWVCPTHGDYKVVPAGVSNKTGKPYSAFRACRDRFCNNTEGRTPAASAQVTCTSCGTTQATGRTTFCQSCGAVLP